MHARRREKRVALLAQDRQILIDRRDAVLALIDGVVAERSSDRFGLVHAPRANRAGVDFDEPDDVGILCLDEVRDALQIAAIAEQVARAGKRPMNRGTEPEAVTNVVEKQAHLDD